MLRFFFVILFEKFIYIHINFLFPTRERLRARVYVSVFLVKLMCFIFNINTNKVFVSFCVLWAGNETRILFLCYFMLCLRRFVFSWEHRAMFIEKENPSKQGNKHKNWLIRDKQLKLIKTRRWWRYWQRPCFVRLVINSQYYRH